MSLKKKLGMGIATGTLGLCLIGGGTWAAFNDVESFDNTFAAGTLDLAVGENTTMEFRISNLKPGDYFTKQLVLENKGSLDINQILMHAEKQEGWIDKDILDLNNRIGAGAGDNSEEEFLSQFSIKIEMTGNTSRPMPSSKVLVYEGTLADLVAGTAVTELTNTDEDTVGLAAGENKSITYDVTITFEEDSETFDGSRLHKQNKYQGEESNLKFVFEATQMKGEER